MAGLGECIEDIIGLMKDKSASGCDILTIGQYMSPTRDQVPVHRYYYHDEFKKLKAIGTELGFKYIESGLLGRSFYHAAMQMVK